VVISPWRISACRPLLCFSCRAVSFLAFQRALENGQGRSNCQSLFGIEKIPSDNYIRDMLDEADPALLAPCFARLEALLAEPPLREAFGRLGGRTLIAWDGTEFFRSQKLGCPHCLTRKRSNGKIESYHAMLAATVVAPGHSKIVPLMPEFIAPQDGAEKQDCERNAVKRWFGKHHARLASLRPVFLGDDLFACQPTAAMVKDNGGDFIFTAKESSHTALYDFIKGAEAFRHDEKIRKSLPPRKRGARPPTPSATAGSRPCRCATARTPCWSTGSASRSSIQKARVKYSMAWVTSLPVTKKNVAEIVACGRTR
jgi:hypothetical protein